MGNIPPKDKVIFTTKFINFIKSSNQYEFEIFRNFPIFIGKQSIYQNINLKGKIKISSKYNISNIQKEILMHNLEITEEKYQKQEKMNNYLILYEIKNMPEFSFQNLEYIPTSKIYFNLDSNYPIIYCQNSSINENEKYYCLRYKYNSLKNEEGLEFNPGLFIFLIDQSGSMTGRAIRIASKALRLFLQSLPFGSYYQIIGFGTNYKIYGEETPYEYNRKNITETLIVIENLSANLGGTNIYSPLKHIYDSHKIHDNIHLPRNIFLLTDGEVDNKDKVLNIIEENNSNYTIYSIGIGNSFDRDLIKNAGIIGRGNYNFCNELTNLYSIIASEINKAVNNYIMDLDIKTSLDKNNIIKNNKIKNVIRENEIINLNYIINNSKKCDKNITLNLEYLEIDKKPFTKKYIIPSEDLEKGDELSKLIISNYLLKNLELSVEEKIKLALKYQIFTEYTSLFAEINLTEKISENTKLKIIGDKNNNFDNLIKDIERDNTLQYELKNNNFDNLNKDIEIDNTLQYELKNIKLKTIVNINSNPKPKVKINATGKNFLASAFSTAIRNRLANLHKQCSSDDEDDEDDWDSDDDDGYENKNEIENETTEMKIIYSQDFIDGNWEENEYTKIIKEKYQKEYKLLKKKFNDKVTITILVILYFHKEHKELLNELIMIIKKAKIFIQKETGRSYENIINKININ